MLKTPIDVQASWGTFATEAGYTQHHRQFAMWKTADDLDRYRKAIESCRPEVLVETGTHFGGFAAWVADTFGVEVVSVDVSSRRRPDAGPLVMFVVGDSVAQAPAVAELVAGRRCMVSLDSDHHAPHVVAEIRAYGPLVSAGCYLVVEDGLADLVGPEHGRRLAPNVGEVGGPLVAIEQTLATWPGWRRDLEIEGLSEISHHPAGWWVRDD